MKTQTVVVTGGSGYIGVEVVTQLLRLKKNIIIIDRVSPPASLRKNNRVSFIQHDLRRAISKKKIHVSVNYVVHLAAKVGGIALANEHPGGILASNLLIDLHAISLAKELQVNRFLYASSSLVYERSQKIPYRESDTDIAPPDLSYGLAKLVGEKTCLAFHKEFNVNYVICRLFNVYGLNSLGQSDPHGHVIPDIINKILSGEYPLSLLGDGRQARQFTHVRDAANGIIAALLSRNASQEIFNIAGREVIIIREIADIIWKISGRNEQLSFTFRKQYTYDLKRSSADTRKSARVLYWQPEISFKEGMRELFEAYQKTSNKVFEQS